MDHASRERILKALAPLPPTAPMMVQRTEAPPVASR